MAPTELDQIGVPPTSRVLASWTFPPSDMVVGMALESTGAKSPHAPTPDLSHLTPVEPMTFHKIDAEKIVDDHPCS